MTSILDIDTTLETGTEEVEIRIAKKRLFTYLYNFAPNGILYVNRCDAAGWSRQSFHFEIDHNTYSLLKKIGVIQPVLQSNVFYDMLNTQVPSKFCKTTKVPTIFVKIHKDIIIEYWDWLDQNQWLGNEYHKKLDNALKDLKDHMFEFYKSK